MLPFGTFECSSARIGWAAFVMTGFDMERQIAEDSTPAILKNDPSVFNT